MSAIDRLGTVQEDILRMLSEHAGEATLEAIREDVSSPEVDSALAELTQQKLVELQADTLRLTTSGQEIGDLLLDKHLAVEEHFELTRTKEEAHRAAHLLEHRVSLAVIEGMEQVASHQREGISLRGLGTTEGLVADIGLEGEMFERLISMGICPGRKIRVRAELPHVIVVEIGGKLLAIEKDIAERIEVVAG